MSLPRFPDRENQPTRDEALNQVISSIAMEEAGLSHIINAEGEKIQYVLGTLPNVPPLATAPTIEDLLAINQSVRDTLDTTVQNQMFLRGKLQTALSAATLAGPTGPTGPAGPPIDPDTTILLVSDGTNTEELKFENTIEFQSDTLEVTVENGPVVKIEAPQHNGSVIPLLYNQNVTLHTGALGVPDIGLILLPSGLISANFSNPLSITMSDANYYAAIAVPLDATLTSISAHIIATSGAVPAGRAVNAAVFRAQPLDNDVFSQIPETLMTIPFEEIIAERQHRFDSKSLNIALSQNDMIFVGLWLTADNTSELGVFVSTSIGLALN